MIIDSSERPTLACIAQITGVSIATVSKVVNGREDVSQVTRTRVLAALEEAGYRSPGRSRISGGPMVVEVAFDSVDSNYAPIVLNGILDLAADAGVEVLFSVTGNPAGPRRGPERKSQRMLDEGRKGLIIVTSDFAAHEVAPFQRKRIPVVVIDPVNPPFGVVSVGAANWAGGRAATEHLLELGHIRIAYLGGSKSAESNQARMYGYWSAMELHGVQVVSDLVIHGKFHPEHGAAGLAALLALPEQPTAIFAGNDEIAVGILKEARRRGIRVPEDLSLVGFDGTALAEDSVPALTSVAQPLHDMGRTSLRMLLQQALGEPLDSTRIELATQLVVRESTAPMVANRG
jgi:LacI family transcriptional regulator